MGVAHVVCRGNTDSGGARPDAASKTAKAARRECPIFYAIDLSRASQDHHQRTLPRRILEALSDIQGASLGSHQLSSHLDALRAQ